MSDIGSGAALLLAAVFAVAGVAKLRRPAATATTFRALRLPAAGAAAVAVPVAELVVAVLLLALPALGAALAIAALVAFTGVLVAAVRGDEAVSCGCFGSAGNDPVTAADLVRNGLLVVAAAVAVTGGAPGLPSLPAAVAVSAAAVTGLVVVALVRVRLATGAGLFDASVATTTGGPDALPGGGAP